MSESPETLNGRCLCGAVTFTIRASFRPIIACHCRQCARWTGHAVYATAVAPERFELKTGEPELSWFRASDTAARGFCKVCGSSLFWKPDSGMHISILAGALDPPTGLTVSAHIFTADASDYHIIADDAPWYDQDVGSRVTFVPMVADPDEPKRGFVPGAARGHDYSVTGWLRRNQNNVALDPFSWVGLLSLIRGVWR
jgi:hypothetical protein